MNRVAQLDRLIDRAAGRNDFKQHGWRSFESEDAEALSAELQNHNIFYTASIIGMESISHVIEEQSVKLDQAFRLYTTFQSLSRFRPQETRYKSILKLGQPVYIFGMPDAPVRVKDPNLHVVELREPVIAGQPHLCNYWVVALLSPKFISMALVARELPSILPKRTTGTLHGNKMLYRNYEGFWTYDQSIINEVTAVLEEYIEQRPMSEENWRSHYLD